MTDADFHWLVGLLEGEGYFGIRRTRGREIPLIRVLSTDRDVIERVAAFWCRAVTSQPIRRKNPDWSDTYSTAIQGEMADYWMQWLRPWMGDRRAARIAEVLRITREQREQRELAVV